MAFHTASNSAWPCRQCGQCGFGLFVMRADNRACVTFVAQNAPRPHDRGAGRIIGRNTAIIVFRKKSHILVHCVASPSRSIFPWAAATEVLYVSSCGGCRDAGRSALHAVYSLLHYWQRHQWVIRHICSNLQYRAARTRS